MRTVGEFVVYWDPFDWVLVSVGLVCLLAAGVLLAGLLKR